MTFKVICTKCGEKIGWYAKTEDEATKTDYEDVASIYSRTGASGRHSCWNVR